MPSVWGGAGGTGSQRARESKLKARDVVTGGPRVPTDRMKPPQGWSQGSPVCCSSSAELPKKFRPFLFRPETTRESLTTVQWAGLQWLCLQTLPHASH